MALFPYLCNMSDSSATANWYALKVFYNKVFDMRDFLERRGLTAYIPLTDVIVERNGVRRKVERPLINSLMFFRATSEQAAALIPEIEGRAMVYSRRSERGLVPAAIPATEMDIFMLVTSRGENGVEYIGDDSPRYHAGDLVSVIDGPFKGSVGRIIRIKNNQRLVVTINGLCAVATSYIPRAFIRKIGEQ